MKILLASLRQIVITKSSVHWIAKIFLLLLMLSFSEKEIYAKDTGTAVISPQDIQKFETYLSDQSTPQPDFSDQPKGNGLDTSEMVYVPAGEFIMGADSENHQAMSWEKPSHEVILDAFWIDKHEVTNGQFAKCVASGYCVQPRSVASKTRPQYYGLADFADYPVIYVDWNQAYYYCAWVGKRLPTEAEWEKAARGTDSNYYPWGNEGDPVELMNCGHLQDGDTEKVGSYPDGASPYGALDMAGNVWEWTADLFDRKAYSNSPRENPKGGIEGQIHTVRGLSWAYNATYQSMTIRNRADAYAFSYDLGFRCAFSEPVQQH
ncbi:formylglycine-generating enzyme family protein [Flexilinea flocculi]|jgi:formylglycine-generating enzyme required for sulfatase activity|uniref:Formylglycine-generating enzyme n=1 Tax=Flexilinea flocculi TaxID=1678840 RepID=A0A0S7BMM6_9CHLR|nr:formylglycine-generating enzyme family protein [Flexilinea flocculi]NMB94331.1 formylglycine-generating enzyme family protein [Flexilinea flocculi]GAP41701.1 formylglycine-generating enzyme [Flexilinea flocculi]